MTRFEKSVLFPYAFNKTSLLHAIRIIKIIE